jgi:hypothetical protein
LRSPAFDVGTAPTIDVMTGTHHRRITVLGVAATGLVLGHWLAYALGTPPAHARDELLRATGHGYLPYATQVALLAGALGLAGLFLTRLTNGEARGSFVGDVSRLAAVQSAAFVTMEIGERLLSGASLHDLTHGPLLAIGLGVQLVLAIVGALILRLTERAAEGAESLGRSLAPPAPALVAASACTSLVAPPRPAMRTAPSRDPPSSL